MKKYLILVLVVFSSLKAFGQVDEYRECLIENSRAGSYMLSDISAHLKVTDTKVGKKIVLNVFERNDTDLNNKKPSITWRTRTFKSKHMSLGEQYQSGNHKIVQKLMGIKIGETKESFILSPDSITLTKYVNENYNKSITCYK